MNRQVSGLTTIFFVALPKKWKTTLCLVINLCIIPVGSLSGGWDNGLSE